MLKSENNSILTGKRVKTSTRVPWSNVINNISSVISGSNSSETRANDLCVISEAEESLQFEELFDTLLAVSKPEMRRAVHYLKDRICNHDNREVLKSTYNRVLLCARLDLKTKSKYKEMIHFRACNALHLGASELEIGRRISFEATLVEDGIILTGLSGFHVRLAVLKGTVRSEITQMELKVTEDGFIMKITTRNPLIDQADSTSTPVELVTDLDMTSSNVSAEKTENINKRKKGAKHLRETYTRMKAFPKPGLSSLVNKNSVNDQFYGMNIPDLTNTQEFLKTLFGIYAILLVLTSFYLYFTAFVPVSVPLTLLITAVSYLLLSAEKQFTIKSKIAFSFNILALLIIVIKL